MPSVCDCVRTGRAGGGLHQGGLNTVPRARLGYTVC